jgi:HK97 family phage portal protein
MSVVEQAREALGLSAALTEHAARTMANDARPSGVLTLGHGSEEYLQQISDAWAARHQGVERAGRVAVVKGEVDYTPVASSAADAQLVEQRQWATAEVARVFNIPASKLGAPTGDSLTYGNREADDAAFVTHSLRPWLVAIEEALNANDELTPGGLFCEFSLEGLLRGDSAARAAFYAAALDPVTGWLSRDEVRRLENLPPEPRQPHTPPTRPQEAPASA